MIGVIADPSDHEVVREFFELFKTPWEFYQGNRSYEVVLTTVDAWPESGAGLVLVYSSRETKFDQEHPSSIRRAEQQPCALIYGASRLPMYGETATFAEQAISLLSVEGSGKCAAFLRESAEGRLARIGYNLFAEIRALLTAGQPSGNAGEPALELHVALLRDLLERAEVSLIEIPPVPEGYNFIACLTHDVDHPRIRLHKWDHTAAGFLYRAVFASLVRLLRGQIPLKTLFANWFAAAKLPFVYLGLADDFWDQFDERYTRIQGNLPSTFFVIPHKDDPGKRSNRAAPAIRASRYGARDLADTIQGLVSRDDEVGLHGIDAWRDAAAGKAELAEIRDLTQQKEIGVRMHWLYFDRESPGKLEEAGAAYDSTIGYNETVGYRAGTTQVFRPLGLTRMLELPMHAMDTALFYPSYLGCSPAQANARLARLVENVSRYGGVLTINWHDRSLAPERCWDSSYRELIELMKSRGAWFATAGQAVAWFRKRRSVAFDTDSGRPDTVRARITGAHSKQTPGLRLRAYSAAASPSSARYLDSTVAQTSIDSRDSIGADKSMAQS